MSDPKDESVPDAEARDALLRARARRHLAGAARWSLVLFFLTPIAFGVVDVGTLRARQVALTVWTVGALLAALVHLVVLRRLLSGETGDVADALVLRLRGGTWMWGALAIFAGGRAARSWVQGEAGETVATVALTLGGGAALVALPVVLRLQRRADALDPAGRPNRGKPRNRASAS